MPTRTPPKQNNFKFQIANYESSSVDHLAAISCHSSDCEGFIKQPLRSHGHTIKRIRGAVLLPTLIMLLTVNMIGATLASLFSSVTLTAEVELSRAQAFYLAEAGITKAIQQLQQSSKSGQAAPIRIPPTPLGGGTYRAYHDFTSGTITATGTYHEISRTLQLKYRVF